MTPRTPSPSQSLVPLPRVNNLETARRGLWSTLVGLILLGSFLPVLFTGTLRFWYESFIVKAVNDLARTDDFDEVRLTDATYYQRPCSSMDVHINGDIVIEDEEEVADRMMTMGVGMFHQLVSRNTTHRLRNYILRRNEVISPEDEIPISPNDYRVAYSVDPAENEAVEKFLDELTHSSLLRATLEFLTGDKDPAITEMAALTSYAGADSQRWHHDVISEYGSAVQFGRTYTHTYSLFVALQDTTAAMGGTSVCPGTHYCGVTQQYVCEENGFTPDNWYAGTGVLFNQQMAHAGGSHESGPPRAMLVVSFTRRPDWQLDGRVFASGLYCFGKWKTWGLTWQDLKSHWYTRSTLLRSLRSLGAWKPKNRNWGVDFITKQILVWNLGENGMEPSALTESAAYLHRYLKIPRFLQGEIAVVDDDKEENDPEDPPSDIYHLYFRTTMRNIFVFLLLLHLLIASRVMVANTFIHQKHSTSTWCLLVVAYAIPTLLAVSVMYGTSRSRWGENITSGRLFREPFPIVKEGKSSELPYPTTVPERTDILIGTRLKAARLGSLTVWLDYHPGNIRYRSLLSSFLHYADVLPLPMLGHFVLQDVGRFLLQDWQSGNWMLLDQSAVDEHLRKEFLKLRRPLLSSLCHTIDQRLDHYRFDVSYRSSSMALITQTTLSDLYENLVATRQPADHALSKEGEVPSRFVAKPKVLDLVKGRRIAPPLRPRPKFHRGETVLAMEEGIVLRAAIYDVYKEDGEILYDLAYENGDEEAGVTSDELLTLDPLVSGMLVHCKFDTDDVWNPFVVRIVRPDGYVDLQDEIHGGWVEDVDAVDFCRWRPMKS